MPDQTKYISKLSGASILILGGSSGLGFAAAEASIEHGAGSIVISSSNPDRVKVAVSRLRHAYPSTKCEISGHACNLGDDNTLESNIVALYDAATISGTKKLDHIIYTAGDPLAIKPLTEVDLAWMKQAGMTRFFGPLLVAKHAPRYMASGPAASITLTTGKVSEKPYPNWTVVGSYATGLHGMTRQLALDLKPIRVNLISPGGVDTELWNGMPKDAREQRMKALAEESATGAIGKPEDVAEAYLYCMKDHNTTGSIISTNSGSLIV